MSKVINKKLHPYYKTGINGWIGEEVDDNDYIICPICGEILGMNYCDYASEQGYNDKCPKCSQELDYNEIYDFEDTCYFEQLLEIKESRLADLEAKLAESNESHHKNIVELTKMATEKDRKIEELKQQLFESGLKTLEEIKLSEQRKKMLEDLSTKNWELEKQLAEKDKEISVLKSQLCLSSISQSIDQDKISFAVEQLEKVKAELEFTSNNNEWITARDDRILNGICDFIDNQIEELKKEKQNV